MTAARYYRCVDCARVFYRTEEACETTVRREIEELEGPHYKPDDIWKATNGDVKACLHKDNRCRGLIRRWETDAQALEVVRALGGWRALIELSKSYVK